MSTSLHVGCRFWKDSCIYGSNSESDLRKRKGADVAEFSMWFNFFVSSDNLLNFCDCVSKTEFVLAAVEQMPQKEPDAEKLFL